MSAGRPSGCVETPGRRGRCPTRHGVHRRERDSVGPYWPSADATDVGQAVASGSRGGMGEAVEDTCAVLMATPGEASTNSVNQRHVDSVGNRTPAQAVSQMVMVCRATWSTER